MAETGDEPCAAEFVATLIALANEAPEPSPLEPVDPDKAVINSKPVWDEHWHALEIGRRGEQKVLVYDFLATSAIIVPDSDFSYEHRWCFSTTADAVEAAVEWLKTGAAEPEGWHRHLPSNRRREHGDPAKEYVLP